MSLIHQLKPVPGEGEFFWVWEHPPFLVRVFLNFQTVYWWAEISRDGDPPSQNTIIMSYKNLEDLASMVEEHLLKEYPDEIRRVLYPPSALARVSKEKCVLES